ncbi:MAG: hypothetical protein KGN84_12355, partial [Acidobacteriota bacterium]|nr:hypothetical protein [Acidobacteriota bacterium]
MRRFLAGVLLLSAAAIAGDKKLASGDASNDAVEATGVVYDAAQVEQTFGTNFQNMFTVIEMTLTPKGGKPLDVHLDDFLLRSSSTSNHSGPLAPAQIAGQDTLVVYQDDQLGRS